MALAVSLAVAARRSPRRTAVAVAVGVGLSVGLDAGARRTALFGYQYPWSFHVWVAAVVVAATVAVASWGRSVGGARVLLSTGVLCTATFALAMINVQYAYMPTVGDAAGRPLVDQVRAKVVSATARGAARTDPPPTLQPTAPRVTGTVMQVKIPSPVSGFRHRQEWVWLPPAWFARPRAVLPVVLMLSGTPGRPDDWLRAGGAAQVADRWAAKSGGLAPILVFADHNGSFAGDTECVDGPRGRAETYLTEDVPRWASSTLGASSDPRRWAVLGLSEGATCALDLVLRHPERFDSAAALSPALAPRAASRHSTVRDLYGGDAAAAQAHDLTWLLGRPVDPRVTMWLAAGTSDRRARFAVAEIAALARTRRVPTEVALSPGGHNYRFWSRSLPAAFAWAANRVSG